MNKIAVYYSIFSFADDISSSMFWILCLAENLKFYMMNSLWKQIDIIICTDSFTKKLIDDVIDQEGISALNLVQFKVHVRWKLFPRCQENYIGKIWRFYAFADDDYDISIAGEADLTLDSTICLLQKSFSENTVLQIMQTKAFDKRAFMFQADYTNGPFNAGELVIRSSALSLRFKRTIKAFLDFLVGSKMEFKFAVDEKLLLYIIEKINDFVPYQHCNSINCILCNTEGFFRLTDGISIEKIRWLEQLMTNCKVQYFNRNNGHILSDKCKDDCVSKVFIDNLPEFNEHLKDSSYVHYDAHYQHPNCCILENLRSDGRKVRKALQTYKYATINIDKAKQPFEYTLNGKRILFYTAIRNRTCEKGLKLDRKMVDDIFQKC